MGNHGPFLAPHTEDDKGNMTHNNMTQFIFEYFESLKKLNVEPASIQKIQNHIKGIEVKSKSTLVNQGEICTHVYLVVEGGFVCRHIHEKTGAANTINFYLDDLHPIMVCLDSYFTQTPTNCELKAISDSVVLALPKTVVDSLVESDVHFAKFQRETMSTAMMEENELKANLISFSSKEKYAFVMKEMPSVIKRVPSKYIAEFCGISAEWLSKLKKQH